MGQDLLFYFVSLLEEFEHFNSSSSSKRRTKQLVAFSLTLFMLIGTRLTWQQFSVINRLLCFEDSLVVCINVELCILLQQVI